MTVASPAQAAKAELGCKLDFNLTGRSLIYKQADGHGTVTCANGQTLPVDISVNGGGLAAGKWHIDNGHGNFTDVHTIDDALGRYVQGEANVGANKATTAQVLTEGTVSLAVAGTGQGVNLGLDVSAFTLSRRGDSR